MNSALRITNFIALSLFGAGVVAIAIAQPNSVVIGALNLVPFGMALIAARPTSTRISAWTAAISNALWALLYIGIAAIVALGLGGSPVAIPIALLVATPCMLNTFCLAKVLKRG